MWPFTSRRIFGSRWWALGFVAFVCWQVADVFDRAEPAGNGTADVSGAAIDNAQMQQATDALNALNSIQDSG